MVCCSRLSATGAKRITAAVVLTAVFLAVGLVNVSSVYGQSISITPSSVQQGALVQVTGSGFDMGEPIIVSVWGDTSGSCVGTPTESLSTSADGSGAFGPLTLATFDLAVGVHCVQAQGGSGAKETGSFTITPATPVPEYPLGPPILLSFVIAAYALTRRETRNEN